MGKKSKKRGAGDAAKAARKERLRERREQQLEDLDVRREEENAPAPPREFFEGDRVWFREESLWGNGTNPNNYRGYVKRVQENSLDIISLQSKIDGTDASVCVPLMPRGGVFPDFCDFTVRFDVGERVLCHAGVSQPQEVHALWPIGEIILKTNLPIPRGPRDTVPAYECVGNNPNIPQRFRGNFFQKETTSTASLGTRGTLSGSGWGIVSYLTRGKRGLDRKQSER